MSQCNFGILVSEIAHTKRCKNMAGESGFCAEHQPKGIMSSDEVHGKLAESLQQFRADVAEAQSACNNIQIVIHRSQEKRKALIAEARGILEGLCVIDGYATGTLTATQYNRLREILDELEKLP